MFLQSGTHPVAVKVCRGGGEKMLMEATLKDVWMLDDGSTLDLLRINTGHTNPSSSNTTAAENGCGGDGYQKQQQDYFESVFSHRGDRKADWAGIYTQLTEEHSERYVPNRWDYTTTAELVRLNLRDTVYSTTSTPTSTTTTASSSSSNKTLLSTTNLHHRSVVLLDLKPQPLEEEEGSAAVVVDDIATDIKDHIVEKCPKTSWRRTTLTIPLLHSGGGSGAGGCTREDAATTTTTITTATVGCVPPSPLTPIWGVVAAHPSFQMSEPTLSSIEKARRLKHSIATASTVPISVQFHNPTTTCGGCVMDIKASSSCTYEVLMEMAVATAATTTTTTYVDHRGEEKKKISSSAASPLLISGDESKGRLLDSGTPLLGRLGELGAVLFVWDDEDSLECVIPHELLVRGDGCGKDNINGREGPLEPSHVRSPEPKNHTNNNDEDGVYGAQLFACRSVRRYWRHPTLPITSRTEDVVV